jgi:hypothetical protein
MKPFDFWLLLWPATLIFFITLLLTFRATKSPIVALLSGLLKSGIFIFYFSWIFDGTYTFLDDWSYLAGGQDLLAEQVGLTNLHQHWEYVTAVGGGSHFLYYLYNSYAQRLFGYFYFSPVALNVVLTVLVAYAGSRLASIEFKLSRNQLRLLYLFLLFHPDILAWSNVMNGKDIFVLLLHVLMLFSVSLFYRNRSWHALLLGIPVVLVLFFLRFYVPLLFMLALMFSILASSTISFRIRLRFLIIGAVLTAAVTAFLGADRIASSLTQIIENFVDPAYGFARTILTPIPFGTESAYAFLDFPALFHWLMMPAVVLGMLKIYRLKNPFSLFFISYFFVFIFLYSVFGELQGPRHRVQLDFAFAIFQFFGLMKIFRSLKKSMKHRTSSNQEPEVLR